MKIVAFQGSPKKKSDTAHLLDAFLNGMETYEPQDVEVIHLIEKDVHPCKGCLFCWRSTELRCIQKDDALDIIGKILDADVVIWSFPLYFFGMPSHVKALLDRTICMEKLDMHQDDTGRVHHGSKADLSAKQVMLVGSGFPTSDSNIFEPLEQQLRYGLDSELTFIGIQETPLFNPMTHKGGFAAYTEPMVKKLTAAGLEFARSGALSDDTLADLKVPMMPLDEYLGNVNASAVQIIAG